jgi:hypothetical protein
LASPTAASAVGTDESCLPRHRMLFYSFTQRIFNHCFSSKMASYDVASSVHQSLHCGRSYDQCGSPLLPEPGLDYGSQWNTQVNCYDDCSGSTTSKASGHCPGATQFPMGSGAVPISGFGKSIWPWSVLDAVKVGPGGYCPHFDARLLTYTAPYDAASNQGDKISHIDMRDDHIDAVISHISSPYPISIYRMTISIW